MGGLGGRRMRSGVMYCQRDTFSPGQKNELRNRITATRQLIAQLRDDLHLEAKLMATSQSIVGQAAVLWEMLTGLNTQGLQGYGKVPKDLTHYLDPIGGQLAAEINEIAGLFSQPSAAATKP